MTQAKTKTQTNDIWKSFKWIGYTAIGVVVGMTVYHKFVQRILFNNDDNIKRNDDDDVNVINDENKWEIPVIGCDDNGESFISKEYFDLKDGGDIGKLSDKIPVKSLKFRTTPSNYFYDWHCAPKEQFIINLDAPVYVTTSDGNSILLKTGQVFIVRDINGKGHFSQSVNNLSRKSVFIAFQ